MAVLDIVISKSLTYEQKIVSMAYAAEDTPDVLNILKKTRRYMDIGAICNQNEGNGPLLPALHHAGL